MSSPLPFPPESFPIPSPCRLLIQLSAAQNSMWIHAWWTVCLSGQRSFYQHSGHHLIVFDEKAHCETETVLCFRMYPFNNVDSFLHLLQLCWYDIQLYRISKSHVRSANEEVRSCAVIRTFVDKYAISSMNSDVKNNQESPHIGEIKRMRCVYQMLNRGRC